jgi:hypothetical protein
MLANPVTGKTCRVTLIASSQTLASRVLRSHTLSAVSDTLTPPLLSTDTLG